jgi:hypothetical protein
MGCPPAGRRTVFPAAQPPRWHPSTTPAPPRWTFVNHGAFGAALRPAFEEAAAWRALCEAQPLSFLDRSLLPQLVRVARQLAAFLSCSPPDLALMPSCTSALNTVLASARVRCALLCCCCAVRCCAVCAVCALLSFALFFAVLCDAPRLLCRPAAGTHPPCPPPMHRPLLPPHPPPGLAAPRGRGLLPGRRLWQHEAHAARAVQRHRRALAGGAPPPVRRRHQPPWPCSVCGGGERRAGGWPLGARLGAQRSGQEHLASHSQSPAGLYPLRAGQPALGGPAGAGRHRGSGGKGDAAVNSARRV